MSIESMKQPSALIACVAKLKGRGSFLGICTGAYLILSMEWNGRAQSATLRNTDDEYDCEHKKEVNDGWKFF